MSKTLYKNPIKNLIKKIIILALAFVMVFTSAVAFNTDDADAASKPVKVSDLCYSAKTSSEVTLSWSKASGAKKYHIAYRTEDGEWQYRVLKNCKSQKKYTLTVPKLSEYTKYYFKVRGINTRGYGAWSDTINVYTNPEGITGDYLPSVVNLRVTRTGPGSISLAWDIEEAQLQTAESDENAENAETVEGQNSDNANSSNSSDASSPSASSEDNEAADNENKEGVSANKSADNEDKEEISANKAGDNDEFAEGIELLELAELNPFENYTFMVQMLMDDGTWLTLTDGLDASTRSYRIGELEMGVGYSFRVVAIDATSWIDFYLINEDGYSNTVSATTNVISGLSIREKYTTRNKIYQQHRSLKVKGLMIHSVGANVQSAERWFTIYNKEGYHAAAVHAFIDGSDGEVLQTMPWNQRAGHAGALANDNYIGVEMCESKYIKYKSGTKFTVSKSKKSAAKASAKKTYDASVKLFAYLCDAYNLNPLEKGTIYSHNEWRKLINFGHYDPEHYWNGLGTGYTMDGFRADVAEVLANSQTAY